MHVVFFDHVGILLDWAISRGITVNEDYYKMMLQDKLHPAIRKKRPNLLQSGVILLHDNAPVHCKSNVVDMLDD